jgi:carboxylesterase type B
MNQVIAASPWFPYQHKYNDEEPTEAYNEFVSAAGCANSTDKLQCLRQADTQVVQNASAKVSEASSFGMFAFVPVTDGSFVRQLPTVQLASKALKGKRILSSNMASEGVPLGPPTTLTLQDFRTYINTTFPRFSTSEKSAIEAQYSYAGDTKPADPSDPLFATSGISLPSAVNQSTFGTGQQQRVFAVFGEYAFVCPSYWAASAFPVAWKYQFSAPPSYHGYDLQALWSGTPTPGASFKHAFRKIWGNFVTKNTPVISVVDAKGGVANSTVPAANGSDISWPRWDEEKPVLLNLNATGGVATFVKPAENLFYNVYSDPGVSNQIRLADAREWEGGRGKRCDFWKSVAADVPY